MFIKDMFFVHEHARKINIWQSAVIVSPFFGPLFAAFMIAHLAWYWPFIIYTIITAIGLTLVVLFVQETYYDRDAPLHQRAAQGLRWEKLIGTAQRRSKQPNTTLSRAMMRPLKALAKPPILLTNAYYFLSFAWAVSTNSTLSQFLAKYYHFTPTSIGKLILISQNPVTPFSIRLILDPQGISTSSQS